MKINPNIAPKKWYKYKIGNKVEIRTDIKGQITNNIIFKAGDIVMITGTEFNKTLKDSYFVINNKAKFYIWRFKVIF